MRSVRESVDLISGYAHVDKLDAFMLNQLLREIIVMSVWTMRGNGISELSCISTCGKSPLWQMSAKRICFAKPCGPYFYNEIVYKTG